MVFPDEVELSVALASAGSLDALIEAILRQIPSNTSGPYPVVLLLDKEGGQFDCVISPGSGGEHVEVLRSARVGSEATSSAKAVFRNAHVYVEDVNKDANDWEDMPSLWWGLLASWTAPLRMQDGSVFGALTLYFGTPKQLTSPVKEAFEAFARRLACAIQSYQSRTSQLA